MKRSLPLLCALLLVLTASSCARSEAPAASQPLAAQTPPPALAPTPEPAGDAAPAPTPAVREEVRLSAAIQRGEDGRLLTGAARGGGVRFLNDDLPGVSGYISGFLLADDVIYAAVKESYYSLEPSALYACSGEGESALVTADLSADGRFCLAGDALFYQSYADGSLWRYDLAAGEAEPVIREPAALLAAAEGYIYYARNGAVFRNDSAMTAETPLFDFTVLRLCADGDGLCDLTYGGDGSAAYLEFRTPDGTLTASVELPEAADSLLYAGGRAYVPQAEAGTILVYDRDGALLDTLALDPLGPYCILWFADAEALYYETFLADDASFALCRLPLGGGAGTVVGEMIQ